MFSKKSLDFLQRFVDTPSPSGFERPAQEVWREYVSDFADEVTWDVQGNSIGIVNKGGGPRIMLVGHCDEIGFMVNYVNDDGYIYFAPIGGVDPAIVPARKVIIHTAKGPVSGVIGRTAIHLQDKDDEKKVSKMHEMWIDIGAKDKKDALKRVAIGDPIVFDLSFWVLNGQITLSEDEFSGLFGRRPNISGDPARYVAQVQISSALEHSARSAASDVIDTLLTFLPDRNGEVRVESKTTLPAPESDGSRTSP